MVSANGQHSAYLSDYDRLVRGGRDAGPWLIPLREQAIARFGQTGFPTTKDEEWRFTNVAPIARETFSPAGGTANGVQPSQLARFVYDGADDCRLVFVDGQYALGLSKPGQLPDGVTVMSLADALVADDGPVPDHIGRYASSEEHGFTALNTAFLSSGAFVHVPRGVAVTTPIHVLYVSTVADSLTVSHPRNLFVVESGAQATIIESYAGIEDGRYFVNTVTELIAGDGAVVDHYKIQRDADSAYHVGTLQIQQAASSTVTSHSVALGGQLVRNNVETVLAGQGADCTLNGLFIANGSRHVDNHLRVDHAEPHCSSREFYKGILTDHARGVFSGRIMVRKDAQKTDAKQTNMNLLLSEDAQIDTKPQLEIFADDVKCTHGATIGQLDDDAIFYLRSRGISQVDARRVLIDAFAGESLAQIKVDAIRTQLEVDLVRYLPNGRLSRG